jgi:CO/xanthine dehydrogenase Mo-binding subunit
VRFVGDAVAPVAATDRHIAEQALALIEVNYEKLPFVLVRSHRRAQTRCAEISRDGNLSVGKGNFSAPIEEQCSDLDKDLRGPPDF